MDWQESAPTSTATFPTTGSPTAEDSSQPHLDLIGPGGCRKGSPSFAVAPARHAGTGRSATRYTDRGSGTHSLQLTS